MKEKGNGHLSDLVKHGVPAPEIRLYVQREPALALSFASSG